MPCEIELCALFYLASPNYGRCSMVHPPKGGEVVRPCPGNPIWGRGVAREGGLSEGSPTFAPGAKQRIARTHTWILLGHYSYALRRTLVLPPRGVGQYRPLPKSALGGQWTRRSSGPRAAYTGNPPDIGRRRCAYPAVGSTARGKPCRLKVSASMAGCFRLGTIARRSRRSWIWLRPSLGDRTSSRRPSGCLLYTSDAADERSSV